MAIELIKSPVGHKLSPVVIKATIIDDGTGEALVYTQTSHALSDGEYVYIQSNFDSYNGFKYVDSIAYDSFKVRDSENSDPVSYIQDAEIEYQVSVLDHGFQCVHLPIVYELKSDLSPNNLVEESYNPNTVAGFSEWDGGNTEIDLDHELTDPVEFSKIEFVGDGPLAGVYTILYVIQNWAVIIDLPYDAGYDMSGYIIVKYYDNYAINVNVYAGYPDTHRWNSIKPFELAAILKFVPDEDGNVKFSISEVLRAYINNRNNLTLDTLPNNTDFSVAFYISYFETYDESDGEDITTYSSDVVEDDFIGYALNAKLEFKSESIGHMSEYINDANIYAKWLTIFENPIIMVGKFFDISFLNQYNGFDIVVTKNGVDYLTINNPGAGIIRVPVEAEAGEEQVCLRAYIGLNSETYLSLSGFQNRGLDSDQWVTGTNPSFTTASFSGATSDYLFSEVALYPNVEHTFYLDISSNIITTIALRLRDADYNVIDSDSKFLPSAGTISFTVTPTEEVVYLDFRVTFTTNMGVTISNLRYSLNDPVPITEEICLTVLEECDDTFIEGARLLEDGNLRLLE